MSSNQTCCICLEDTQKLLPLLPCRHANVCSSCIYRLDDKKCPTCRRRVDFVDVNFFLKSKITDTDSEDCQANTWPATCIRIPLESILEHKGKVIRNLVDSTFQVYFVGSSGVSLLGDTSQVVENFAHKESNNEGRRRKLLNSSRGLVEENHNLKKRNNDANGMKYLFDSLFDMNEWKMQYSANVAINGRLIRIHCFEFWEFLRILRSGGTSEGILPDLIVTCVDPYNERYLSEAKEMQGIMTECYAQCGRNLYNIWLDISGNDNKKRLEKIFYSMTEVVWPRKVVALPKSLNPRKREELGDVVLNECLESRKNNCYYRSTSYYQ